MYIENKITVIDKHIIVKHVQKDFIDRKRYRTVGTDDKSIVGFTISTTCIRLFRYRYIE